MRKIFLVVAVSACSAELTETPELSTLESAVSNKTVTTIRVNGLSAFALLFDETTSTNGFLTASQDQVAGTSALDFAYATPSPTDPDIVILVQGAGEIPNEAFVATVSSATLDLTTPFPTTRCEVSLETGDFVCAEHSPIAIDLTWTQDGFMLIHEKFQRTEVFGPVTTKIKGEFEQRSALVDGTWNGHSGTHMNGELFDSQSKTTTREIEMLLAP